MAPPGRGRDLGYTTLAAALDDLYGAFEAVTQRLEKESEENTVHLVAPVNTAHA